MRIWGWDRGQAPGAVRVELRSVSEHKALLVGPPHPPGLRGWERTAVPCVRSLLGLPTGGNVVFSSRSCRSGRAEGLGVRGQAGLGTHTAPLCSLNEVLAVPWPGLAPLPPLRGGLGLYLAPVGTELPPAGSPLPGLGAGGVPGHHPWAGGWGLRGGDAGMASAPQLGAQGELPRSGTRRWPWTRAGSCEGL